MKNNLLDLLNEKLKPAMGCTEPIAIALAGAVAMHNSKDTSIDKIEKIEVNASVNIIKNAMGVMLPHVYEAGIDLAVTLGVLSYKNYDKMLEVLNSVDEDMIKKAKEIIKLGKVKINLADTKKKLFIEVILTNENEKIKVIIEDYHTNISLIEVNGKVILIKENKNSENDKESNSFDDFDLEDIMEFVENVNIKDLKIIEDTIILNKKISEEGIKNPYGLEVARTIINNINKGYYHEDIQKVASYVTAAGSDARMGGARMAVMSNSGSGNQGIVATLPIVAVGEKLKIDNEKIIRGVTLSHLVSIYIKMKFGVLSAFCGAVVAGIGASCGIVYIMGGTRSEIEMAINNMVGNITGMICDGAKPGCALKVAQVASTAVDSALLSLAGKGVSSLDGIVTNNYSTTINNFTRLSQDASEVLDGIILDSMLNK
ncbi:MAG: L-serine ammonia-lyase, iron-sulfur-dependent, subunit alpha [Firmicutes bacterium]|nr:L-serine ammonia-lyase, iron-sulfur-dependent, subunit alpha [Bacillota bacterium]